MTDSSISDDRLRRARVQAHHASQVLSATCDALLERADDDSQSSLAWDEDRRRFRTRRLPGGSTLTLSIGDRALSIVTADGAESTIEFGGRTRGALLEWATAHVPELAARDERPAVRSYDLPEADVASGGAFETSDGPAFARLEDAFDRAHAALDAVRDAHGPATELLLWPHHFDLGSVLLFDAADDPAQDPCVGIGFTAGDDAIAEPYFYANPYAVDRPEEPASAAPLRIGEWATSWFGAALRARDAGPGDVAALARTVVDLTRAWRSTA